MKKIKITLSMLLVLSFLLFTASSVLAETVEKPDGKEDIPALFSITEEK